MLPGMDPDETICRDTALDLVVSVFARKVLEEGRPYAVAYVRNPSSGSSSMVLGLASGEKLHAFQRRVVLTETAVQADWMLALWPIAPSKDKPGRAHIVFQVRSSVPWWNTMLIGEDGSGAVRLLWLDKTWEQEAASSKLHPVLSPLVMGTPPTDDEALEARAKLAQETYPSEHADGLEDDGYTIT